MSWAWYVGFLLTQVAIGVWASRRIGSEEDFFVAGRRLGTPLVALSLFATWFGAETCLGAAGAVYQRGLSGARADPFGYALCLVLMGLFLAARFSAGRFMTLADLYRERFGVATERLAVLLMVPSSLIWGAAQVRAFAQVLATTSQIQLDTALLTAALVVTGYTMIGGLMGDVVTDLVQGLILSAGLVLLMALTVAGPPTADALALALAPQRLSMLPVGESVWVQLDRWSVPVLGSLVAQELISRVLAARTPTVARRASLIACGVYLAVGALPIVLGLIGPALLPGLADPEQLLPELARLRLPHALYMLFSCSLMAAILSTVDSILLSSSALLSHNLLVPALRITSERGKLWTGRALVVLAGMFAYGVALHGDSIYALVESASTFGTAGILVITIAGLYGRVPADGRAALAALVFGLVTTPVARHLVGLPAPFLTTIAVSAIAFVLVAGFSRAIAGPPSITGGE